MVKTSFKLILSCLCFTVVYCHRVGEWSETEPWVTPVRFVDDGKPYLEFTCEAYLKETEWVTWYMIDQKGNLTYAVTIKQKIEGYRRIDLIWTLQTDMNMSKIYCAKEKDDYASVGYKGKINSTFITITFNRTIPVIDKETIVTPTSFVDDCKKIIEFICWSFLKTDLLLTWFQKDAATNKTSRLRMSQAEFKYGHVKIVLRKTLEPSDNNSLIYCSRGSLDKEESNSDMILIQFGEHIKPLETPYISVGLTTNVVLFDDDEILEFNCTGSEPIDDRYLTWRLNESKNEDTLLPVQHFNKSETRNHLTLLMKKSYHKNKLFCSQDYYTKLSDGQIITYGERARSNNILLFRRLESDPGGPLQVYPEDFIDEPKTFILHTCYAFLETSQLLTWYQKRANETKDELVRVTQLLSLPGQAPRGQWVLLTLNKTVDQSDNSSTIRCVKTDALANGTFSGGTESREIVLAYTNKLQPVEQPFISITPNDANVYFIKETTLEFTCSGNKPVDGRNFTWYIQDLALTITAPEGQTYDPSTNTTVLKLNLTEAHNLVKLFCVHGYLSFIWTGDQPGSPLSRIYGEVARSDVITLTVQPETPDSSTTDTSYPRHANFWMIWGLVGTGWAVTLVAAVTTAVMLCRARSSCCTTRKLN